LKSLDSHNNRLNHLENENVRLNKEVNQLKRDQDVLYKEVRDRNLIINGLNDTVNEDNEHLYEMVCEIILQVTGGCDIKPDVVYRLGKFTSGKTRAVRVKFISVRDREKVFSNRLNSTKPIYINADLQYSVRRDFGMLRQKSKELEEKGVKCDIDFNARSLTTSEGGKFIVTDGKIIDTTLNKSTKRRLENTTETETQSTERAARKKAKPLSKTKQKPFLGEPRDNGVTRTVSLMDSAGKENLTRNARMNVQPPTPSI